MAAGTACGGQVSGAVCRSGAQLVPTVAVWLLRLHRCLVRVVPVRMFSGGGRRGENPVEVRFPQAAGKAAAGCCSGVARRGCRAAGATGRSRR